MRPVDNDEQKWLKISSYPEVYTWSKSNDNFFDLRMLAIRLKDQTLLIYSPLPLQKAEDFAELDHLGIVAWILAPNHFHNMGIKPFRQRFPSIRVVSSSLARVRLEKITSEKIEPLSEVLRLWPEGLKPVEPEGLKAGEVWLQIESKDSGPILVVCDAFFNMPAGRRNLFGIILWLGGTAPGLKVSRVFRLIGIKDSKRYRLWFQTFIKSFQAKILVPSHGHILLDENLSDKLVELLP